MPGFFLTNIEIEGYQIQNEYPEKSIKGSVEYGDLTIQRNVLNVFLKDKIFVNNDKFIIITDGIIINSDDLKKRYSNSNLAEIVTTLLEQNKKLYLELGHLTSGAVYNKMDSSWTIHTNHTGDRAIFYYYNSESKKYIVGSQLNYVTDFMKLIGIPRKPDVHGLSCLLDFGCFLDNHTGVKDVFRLFPGDYLTIDSSGIAINNYYHAEFEPKDISLNDAIEQLDVAFLNALTKIINKNKEYDLKVIADLSGGLDSRIICYGLRHLNCENMLALTYGQSTCIEVKIAKKVSDNLKLDWYFKSLDNGKIITQVDEILPLNSGAGYYFGITGGKDFLEILDNRICGTELTGLLGDIYEGAMITDNGLGSPDTFDPRFRASKILPLDKTNTFSNNISRFRTNEIYWLYMRGMLAGMNTFLIRQNFVEPVTPFGDPEFLKAYLSIPWEMRVKDRALLQWLIRKYPDAAAIPYTAIGISVINEHSALGWFRKRLYQVKNKILGMITKYSPTNMNPFDYWMKHDPTFKVYMDEYFAREIDKTKIPDNLNLKIHDLYTKDTTYFGKGLALTLLGYFKRFLD